MEKQNKKIKALLGQYIYLEMPPKPEHKIIVDENTKEALQKSMLKELNSLKIYARGLLANELLVVGERVLVDPSVLANPNTVTIPLKNEKGDDINVILVQDFQIIHIWDNE